MGICISDFIYVALTVGLMGLKSHICHFTRWHEFVLTQIMRKHDISYISQYNTSKEH